MVTAMLGPGQFCTVGGHQISVLEPEKEYPPVLDLLRALCHTCRFGGHLRRFYPVAMHLVHAARLVEQRLSLDTHYSPRGKLLVVRLALLHDFHESVSQDMLAPTKAVLPEYVRRIERPWERRTLSYFGLEEILADGRAVATVSTADRDVFLAEHYDLRSGNGAIRAPRPPDAAPVNYVEPGEAWTAWISKFRQLWPEEDVQRILGPVAGWTY